MCLPSAMTVLTRGSRAVALLALLALVLPAAPASAGSSPRLNGHWVVKTKITYDKNVPGNVGSVAKKRWSFNAQCDAPSSCATTLVRPRNTGHPKTVTTTLHPDGSQYTGTAVYKSACFLNNGGIVEKAYTITEKTTINVTKTNAANAATVFGGKLVLLFAPTAAGKNHNCHADKIVLKVHST